MLIQDEGAHLVLFTKLKLGLKIEPEVENYRGKSPDKTKYPVMYFYHISNNTAQQVKLVTNSDFPYKKHAEIPLAHYCYERCTHFTAS